MICQAIDQKCGKMPLPPKPSTDLAEIWPQLLQGKGRPLHIFCSWSWSSVRFEGEAKKIRKTKQKQMRKQTKHKIFYYLRAAQSIREIKQVIK